MTNMSRVLLGTFLTLIVFSILAAPILAQDLATVQNQYRLAEEENGWTYRYANQNRVTINKTGDFIIEGNINFNQGKINNKEFSILITDAPGDINMNMTCTEEQEELGLLNGNRLTARNRNRFQYQEGFIVNISCNCTQIQARLRIRATELNREGTWAYYNGETDEWVSVQTTAQDGYLVADTTHFSVWTVLIPEVDYTPWIILGGVVAGVAVLGIVIYIVIRRR